MCGPNDFCIRYMCTRTRAYTIVVAFGWQTERTNFQINAEWIHCEQCVSNRLSLSYLYDARATTLQKNGAKLSMCFHRQFAPKETWRMCKRKMRTKVYSVPFLVGLNSTQAISNKCGKKRRQLTNFLICSCGNFVFCDLHPSEYSGLISLPFTNFRLLSSETWSRTYFLIHFVSVFAVLLLIEHQCVQYGVYDRVVV